MSKLDQKLQQTIMITSLSESESEMDTWVGRRRILKSKSEATTEQMK